MPVETCERRLCFESVRFDPNVRCGLSCSPQSWVTNISKISENDFQAARLLGSRWKFSIVDTQTLGCKVNNRPQARYLVLINLQKAHQKHSRTLIFLSTHLQRWVDGSCPPPFNPTVSAAGRKAGGAGEAQPPMLPLGFSSSIPISLLPYSHSNLTWVIMCDGCHSKSEDRWMKDSVCGVRVWCECVPPPFT